MLIVSGGGGGVLNEQEGGKQVGRGAAASWGPGGCLYLRA
jgi:hypothetical protein